MGHEDLRRGFTFVQVLSVGAVLTAAAVGLKLPVLASVGRGQDDPQTQALHNVREISLAGIMYSADYDDAMPLLVAGSYRNMQDVKDGEKTTFGEQRADAWPLLINPYIKTRESFIDPTRGDLMGIWSGPPLAKNDKLYGVQQNTYVNQDKYPMFGMNYLFMSPGVIPKDKLTQPNSMDFMQGEMHTTLECDDPSGTISYLASKNYADSTRGYFAVNAPGLWQTLPAKKNYVIFSGSAPCSGDWCYEANTSSPGAQQETNSAYFNAARLSPVTFIDGHARMMTDAQMADGTSYLTAVPNDGAKPKSNLGGCVIVDKSHYLWNLADNYYGA